MYLSLAITVTSRFAHADWKNAYSPSATLRATYDPRVQYDPHYQLNPFKSSANRADNLMKSFGLGRSFGLSQSNEKSNQSYTPKYQSPEEFKSQTKFSNLNSPKSADRLRNSYTSKKYLYDESKEGYGYLPREGYLDPNSDEVMFHPVYFYLPFKKLAIAEDSKTEVMVPNIGGDDYQDREFGSTYVNSMPAWMQMTLRMMGPIQENALPVDPKLQISPYSKIERKQKQNEIQNKIEKLNELKAPFDSKMAEVNEWLRVKQLLSQNDKDLETSKAQIKELNEKLLELQKNKTNLQEVISKIKREHFLVCLSEYYCDEFVGEQKELLNNISASEKNVQNLIQDTKTNIWNYNLRVGQYTKWQTDSFQKLKNLNLTTDEQINSLKQEIANLQKQIDQANLENREYFGLTELDNNELNPEVVNTIENKHCEKLVHFEFPDKFQIEKNPLFETELKSPLQTTREAEIVLCLNKDSKIQSVHLLQDKEFIATSTVDRDNNGQIKGISIFNRDGIEVENHSWTRYKEKEIEYRTHFVSDDGLVGISTSLIER
jgi:hypothetical protein